MRNWILASCLIVWASAAGAAPASPVDAGKRPELFGSRTVFLIGDVDDKAAGQVIRDLNRFADSGKAAPVTLAIASSGGDVSAAVAIQNAIRSFPVMVHTVCIGVCESSAALILASATGRRAAVPSSLIMVHGLRWYIQGQETDELATTAKGFETIQRLFIANAAAGTGLTPAAITKLMQVRRYLSPEDALKEKLIDLIVEPSPNRFTTEAAGARP
jgi:ATP-dependent Clp protease protease subunit